MEDSFVVITPSSKSGEVAASLRSVIVVELDGDGALI